MAHPIVNYRPPVIKREPTYTVTETPVMPPPVDAAVRVIEALAERMYAANPGVSENEQQLYHKACETVSMYLTTSTKVSQKS